MVLSSVTRYIGQCQDYCNQALGSAKTMAAKPFNWFKAKWADAIQSEGFKPIYERYIQPLNRIDAYLISGCLLVAISIVWIANRIFGKSMFTASFALSLMLFIGCWKLTRYRAETVFKKEAHKILSDMIGVVLASSQGNLHQAEITEERGKLRHAKFEFLKDELTELDNQIGVFRRDATRANAAQFNDFRGALVKHLERVVEKLPTP